MTQDVSVEECVEISKKFGQRLAQELGVPVFLYGYASNRDYRKTMPQVSLEWTISFCFIDSFEFKALI